MSFEKLVNLDGDDWEYAVRVDIRRRMPSAFESCVWVKLPRLLDAMGRPAVDMDRLFLIPANRLGTTG